jgi:hypothetical protein
MSNSQVCWVDLGSVREGRTRCFDPGYPPAQALAPHTAQALALHAAQALGLPAVCARSVGVMWVLCGRRLYIIYYILYT